MRIIKPAEITKECKFCHTLLGIVEKDVYLDGHGWPWVKCCKCGRELGLERHELIGDWLKD